MAFAAEMSATSASGVMVQSGLSKKANGVETIARARLLAAPKPKLRECGRTTACGHNAFAVVGVLSLLALSEMMTCGQCANNLF